MNPIVKGEVANMAKDMFSVNFLNNKQLLCPIKLKSVKFCTQCNTMLLLFEDDLECSRRNKNFLHYEDINKIRV